MNHLTRTPGTAGHPLLDHLKLHFIVVIWGFTSVLGALIKLPAIDLVTYRTAIATIGIAAIVRYFGGSFTQPFSLVLRLFGVGMLVGLHWMLFFAGVKEGGASIGVIGLSTSTLWAALLTPLFLKRRLSGVEFALGVVVVGALAYIFQVEHAHIVGLLLSIAAGFVAALFSHFNGRLTQHVHHMVISFYEMLGAVAACLIGLCWFYAHRTLDVEEPFIAIPTSADMYYLLALALVCTVYPYTASVELLKRISVFATNLAVNLEPVYGIVMAAILLDEHKWLTPKFYVGSTVIVFAVFAYPAINYLRAKQRHMV